jgi:hypothetical protein
MSHPVAWMNLGTSRLGEVKPRRNVGFTSIGHNYSKHKLEAYMSALPPKADSRPQSRNVRYGPIADMSNDVSPQYGADLLRMKEAAD